MITMYGISNCDTIKKARRWMDENNIAYQFHDYRKDGLTEAQLTQWTDSLGWEALLNRRGTTWRKLPEATRDTIDHASAIAIMLENPAIIKRPLLVAGDHYQLGFQPAQWQTLLTN
ncbi:ArsC family reductase [Kistimonas asteriae]|uniref:ArsC family reductase n=1 Tax=Kistimonas asteriae TaxID=517724 RepID=UPI001BAD5763|nr:ArsC family reductase [Kistimonas asteriae]